MTSACGRWPYVPGRALQAEQIAAETPCPGWRPRLRLQRAAIQAQSDGAYNRSARGSHSRPMRQLCNTGSRCMHPRATHTASCTKSCHQHSVPVPGAGGPWQLPRACAVRPQAGAECWVECAAAARTRGSCCTPGPYGTAQTPYKGIVKYSGYSKAGGVLGPAPWPSHIARP